MKLLLLVIGTVAVIPAYAMDFTYYGGAAGYMPDYGRYSSDDRSPMERDQEQKQKKQLEDEQKAADQRRKAYYEAAEKFRELEKSTAPHIIVWESRGPMDGDCLKLDAATKGNRFKAIVDPSGCRVSDLGPTEMKWLAEKKRCVEFDLKTQGQRYAVQVPPARCRPEKTEFRWETSVSGADYCVEVGPGGFEISASALSCAPRETRCQAQGSGKYKTYYLVDAKTNGKEYSSSIAGSDVCGPDGIFSVNKVLSRLGPDATREREVVQNMSVKSGALERIWSIFTPASSDTADAR